MANKLISDDHYDALIEAFEWQYDVCVDEVNQTPPEKQRCDPGCPGWAVFSEDRGMGQAIQRCDTCKVFSDDHAVLTYVLTRLGYSMERRHRDEIEKQEPEAEETPQ